MKTKKCKNYLLSLLIVYGSSYMLRHFIASSGSVPNAQIATHHVTRHNTPIHNILSTAPQLSISHRALGTLPEAGNVMSKHVGATIYN
jgi:hypothetical protein